MNSVLPFNIHGNIISVHSYLKMFWIHRVLCAVSGVDQQRAPCCCRTLICITPPSEYVSRPMRARQETPVTPASEPPPSPPESFICPARGSEPAPNHDGRRSRRWDPVLTDREYTRWARVCVCECVCGCARARRSGADAAGVTGIRPDLLNVGVRKQRAPYERLCSAYVSCSPDEVSVQLHCRHTLCLLWCHAA